jgi:hypothetical protein
MIAAILSRAIGSVTPGRSTGAFPCPAISRSSRCPAAPEVRSIGCICSPQQNRNGAGIESGQRVQFFTLYWCPVHGVAAIIEALRSEGRVALAEQGSMIPRQEGLRLQRS